MSQSLLLRGARQLLTLRGEPSVRRGLHSGNLEVIEDGSVFIQGGKIVSVGSTRRLENLKAIRGVTQIPVHNCIVMPGFVDPSLELSLLSRSVSRTASDAPGLKRARLRDFYAQTLTLLRLCLQHGTLNVGVRARSGVQSRSADLSVLRQLARIGNNPVGLTRFWSPEPGLVESDLIDIATISRRKLADSIFLKPGYDRTSHALSSGMNIAMDWTLGLPDDFEECLTKSLPASVFCHYGLSAYERKIVAASNAAAVFKAGGVLLDSQPGDSARELVEEGGAIALGSGYDGVDEPNFNMQLVLALAVRRLNLTIEQAIVATTINAAYALNRGSEMGSLEPGKTADLLVLNLKDYREIPRRLGVNHVALAIRRGEVALNRTKWKVGAA